MRLSQIEERLIQIIEKPGPKDPECLLQAIRALDTILDENREALPSELAHFLDRRSYLKALAWIRAEQPPAPEPGAPRCKPRLSRSRKR